MEKSKVCVMLDNGHGQETPGKRSPKFSDGRQLFEWEWNRKVVDIIISKLEKLGIETWKVTPENKDVPLTTRANRINNKYSTLKSQGKKGFMISVHVNAGPGTSCDSQGWGHFKGWSVWTTVGKTNSDILAECLWEAAHEMGVKTRQDMSDGDHDYESNFTVIFKPVCVAVLTENFFMNDKEECEWLLSPEGTDTCAQIHVNGILKYIEKL